MESHATPLLVLSQSKLVENTARFLQNKIDAEKCGKDWICLQNLVSSLMQTKFYSCQNLCFLTDNIPALELDASLLDLSKLLLENSCYELRNAPITAKTLFGNKIKEVAKGNFEAQQQNSWHPP